MYFFYVLCFQTCGFSHDCITPQMCTYRSLPGCGRSLRPPSACAWANHVAGALHCYIRGRSQNGGGDRQLELHMGVHLQQKIGHEQNPGGRNILRCGLHIAYGGVEAQGQPERKPDCGPVLVPLIHRLVTALSEDTFLALSLMVTLHWNKLKCHGTSKAPL